MNKEKRLLLIINPGSGRKKANGKLFEIINIFSNAGYEVTVIPTEYPRHATELAVYGSENFDLIVCCGGDGTLSETINGLMVAENKIPLGYIPAGTTNDLATSLKLPTEKIEKCAEIIVSNAPKNHDVGYFNDRYFTYIASFGAFTEVSYNTSQSLKNMLGHLAYVIEGAKNITKIKSYNLSVSYDDKEINGDFIFGAVSNSTSIGGVVKLNNPEIDFNDGLFEVLLIKKPKNIIDLTNIINRLMASNFDDEEVMLFSTPKLKIQSDEQIDWSLDGEFCRGETETVIQNIKSGIKLIY